ncbi:MAG: preprotein translocase subunit SecY [Christensenellales bacterium]|jgi:preprotein translocase subunit SecY
MIEVIRNAWKIPDLRKKILYTLLMILVFRIGSFVPIPGVNIGVIASIVASNGLLQMLDLFNGGALGNFTWFAAGISPYITASIVIQLLTIAIPKLEEISKDGEAGKQKINRITRIVGVAMGFVTSLGLALTYGSTSSGDGQTLLINPVWYNYVFVALVAMSGSAFCIWIGDGITEKGIGNGISLLIFINIVSRVPSTIIDIGKSISSGSVSGWWLPVIVIGVTLILVGIVFVDRAERRIPIQYAKRVVGRKMYGGQATHIPMKVNNSGVMPLIFASTMLQFPAIILSLVWPKGAEAYNKFMSFTGPWYALALSILILFFAYFYSTIAFNPIEISKNLQQNGGFIPGIRPGIQTSQYLGRVSSRITLFSALFLAILALLPTLVYSAIGISGFAATSMLIMVSVALETTKTLESQLLMRHYKGFLR